MKSSVEESSAQKAWRMPRYVSEVTTRSSLSPSVRHHTFNTPFASGARYDRSLPSGDSVGDAYSGFPNSTSRGMISVEVVAFATTADARATPLVARIA